MLIIEIEAMIIKKEKEKEGKDDDEDNDVKDMEKIIPQKFANKNNKVMKKKRNTQNVLPDALKAILKELMMTDAVRREWHTGVMALCTT